MSLLANIAKLKDKRVLWSILKRVLRRLFAREYSKAMMLVVQAESDPQLTDGFAKLKWVGSELLKDFDELKDYAFLVNFIVEAAVAEMNEVRLINEQGYVYTQVDISND